jgi:hypothetical protein
MCCVVLVHRGCSCTCSSRRETVVSVEHNTEASTVTTKPVDSTDKTTREVHSSQPPAATNQSSPFRLCLTYLLLLLLHLPVLPLLWCSWSLGLSRCFFVSTAAAPRCVCLASSKMAQESGEKSFLVPTGGKVDRRSLSFPLARALSLSLSLSLLQSWTVFTSLLLLCTQPQGCLGFALHVSLWPHLLKRSLLVVCSIFCRLVWFLLLS